MLCKHCNKEKQPEEFYLRSKKRCKKCTSIAHSKTPKKEILPDGHKRCTKCKQIKLLSNFSFAVKRMYLSAWCKDCVRSYVYFKKYGITLEEYLEMLKNQENKCKICDVDKEECDAELSVDHDHKTGKLRSLLCRKCNTGIGSFKDDIELMEKAIEYLKTNEIVV